MTLNTLKRDLVALNRVARDLASREAAAVTDTDKLTHRVASRWVSGASGAMRREYDIMLRLQTLEGAANVKDGIWWKKGKRGLPLAQAAFEKATVDPEWFSTGYTRMYEAVEANVARAISSMGLPVEADELINLTLMGQSLTKEDKAATPIPRSAGKTLKSGILSGKESPVMVGKGVIASWIKQKLITLKRDAPPEQEMPTDEDGKDYEFAAPSDEPEPEYSTPHEFLSAITYRKMGDPLGKKFRALMKKAFTNNRDWSPAMLYWLEQAEKGRFVQRNQMADWANISPGSFSVNYWKAAWAAFFKELWADKSLLKEIKKRLQAEELFDEIVKPDLTKLKDGNPLSIILPRNRNRKKKKADRDMVEHVTTRWMDGSIIEKVVHRHVAERPDSVPVS